MKQVLQHARSGEITVEQVPAPQLLPGCALVRVRASLVSAGTERASAEFARKSLLQKAKARPDLVRDVFGKVQRDGIVSAIQAVRSRLDQPQSPGYSSAGTVLEIGEGVSDIRPGDRVSCAGAGFAVHAEIACVPRLLLSPIPDQEGNKVSFDEAAFATLGAVALHGLRTAEVKLGDTVALLGLGLLGQLTLQLLKAAGCRVLGMDINPARAELARQMGADFVSSDPSTFQLICAENTRGAGADSVLITAETSSSEPVNLAGAVARDRAIVVAVGTVGIDIERKAYYEKELDFRVSRSYGPGRYDAAFEQKGRDYPIGYVRWTETRNMNAFLQLVADGKVRLTPLITHRFRIDDAQNAYELITGKTGEPFLGVVIQYPGTENASRTLEIVPPPSQVKSPGNSGSGRVTVGVLGAGMFASGTLIPAMKESAETDLALVCAANGSHAQHAAKRFGFAACTTDESEIILNPQINTVVIATRHHLHARQVAAALAAGKNVFCEKPLCLSEQELSTIVGTWNEMNAAERPVLMVGFNRRFAPMTVRLKQFLSGVTEPLALHYRINAGYLPPDHWTNDPEQGGGRILGELCHFVDLLAFLAESPVAEVEARSIGDSGRYSRDNVVVSLRFSNGSEGSVSYLANGDRSFSKERIEIFGGGSVAVLEGFRELQLVRNGRKESVRSRWRQDKGHRDEWSAFVRSIQHNSAAPIPFEDILNTTLATLRIDQSVATGTRLPVNTAGILDGSVSKLMANSDLNA